MQGGIQLFEKKLKRHCLQAVRKLCSIYLDHNSSSARGAATSAPALRVASRGGIRPFDHAREAPRMARDLDRLARSGDRRLLLYPFRHRDKSFALSFLARQLVAAPHGFGPFSNTPF